MLALLLLAAWVAGVMLFHVTQSSPPSSSCQSLRTGPQRAAFWPFLLLLCLHWGPGRGYFHPMFIPSLSSSPIWDPRSQASMPLPPTEGYSVLPLLWWNLCPRGDCGSLVWVLYVHPSVTVGSECLPGLTVALKRLWGWVLLLPTLPEPCWAGMQGSRSQISRYHKADPSPVLWGGDGISESS